MRLDTELLTTALRNLTQQKLRSYLTLIGVVIGIAAIVTLIALGNGLNNAVVQQFEQLGSNTLFIVPGGSTGGSSLGTLSTIRDSDIDKIRKLSDVSEVIAPVATTATITFNRETASVTIMGIDPAEGKNMADTGFVEVEGGRNFDSGDGFVALVGNKIATDFFEKEIELRDRIQLNGKTLRVVGITKENSQSFGGGPNINNTVIIPLKTFEAIFGESPHLFLLVKAVTKDDVDNVKTKVEKIFEKTYGKDQKEFTVFTSQQILDRISQVLGIIQLFLVGIAGISLLVGGIGIMNTMIMAVMERTKEIGVMKAIGATNELILALFLLEAGFIGLVGGLIGIVIGYGLAFLVQIVATSMLFSIQVSIDPLLIAGALLFAMGVGMASGVYPARRAALLDPVDALRSGE